MMRSAFAFLLGLALLLAASPPAAAQGTTAPLSGVVVDTDGGVIPGATVEVKNNATGVAITVVSNSTGVFSVPALDAGTYTVTVSLTGFKTVVMSDIRMLAGTPQEVRATLEVGSLTETVEVRGGTELVQTQSATVQSTISVEQISNLPLVSRNALNFVVFLPGVETTGGPRGSTIMGLPQNTINITIDGITTGNLLQSGDGFFSLVTPRLDAVEEITVTGAVPGAAGGGQGSVQIGFVTRSGSNTYQTSLYHYFRHPSLNSNYFFNKLRGLDRNEVIVHQYGGRLGGPIRVPGLIDGRGRAFFFFNYEHFFQPTEVTRTRTILNTAAQTGTFAYQTATGIQTVNLLTLAAANGYTSTVDPTVAALLAQIRTSTGTTGVVTASSNPNRDTFVFQSPSRRNEWAPTGRVDFNLTPKHRLTGTYYWQRFHSNPDILNGADPQFPNFPNYGIQASYRTTGSITLRSTLSANLVNEAKTGWQWSPVDFFGNVTPDMFNNQGGYNLSLGFSVSNVTGANSPQPRNTVNWSVEDTLNWLKGNHSFSFGMEFQQVTHNQHSKNSVPSLAFGLDNTNDPARLMFNTTNIPGASTTDLTNARALYALLTGRVTSISGTMRLSAETGEYVYIGNLFQRSRMEELGFYAQDAWRISPTVTLNYGLRYELQSPAYPLTETWSTATMADICGVSGLGTGPEGRQCNLFNPGEAVPGFQPQYIPYQKGNPGYNKDYNNVAPNVGVAWRPNVQDGWLRTILGDPDLATVRGGFSVSYNRERLDRFTGLFGSNPGGTTSGTRNNSNGNLVYAGEAWPVLFRETSRLGPPNYCPEGTVSAACVPRKPAYPILATTANSVNIFDPDLAVPYTQSWSTGFQRSLGRTMAVEVRYVGNRNMRAWTTENWNALNIFENGFLEEFKLAQANLLANVAAGRGGTFAYFGPGTGTSPLPTYLAHFSGVAPSLAGDASRYTSTNFTSTTYTGHLGLWEPDPFSAASNLYGTATQRANAIAAGLPSNFFRMNPNVSNANVTVAKAGSRYHSLQVDFRRRFSRGLLVNTNYTYAYRLGSSNQDLHLPRFYLQSTGIPHAWKTNWTYEIPVGRGRRFGTDMNPWLDGVLGNWEFSGTGRVQIPTFSFEGRLVGMSRTDLSKIFKIRIVPDPLTGVVTVFSMPDDVILNTRRAFSTSPTSATGYGSLGPPEGRYFAPQSEPGCIALFTGDCGVPRIIFKGPMFSRFDMRLKKKFPFGRKASFELDIEVLNVFDNINFNHNFNPGSGSTIFQVSSAYTDINTTYDPGGRIGQIVWRVNW